MIYTDLTKRAMKLMAEAHKDQLDHSGLPYMLHPFHVAEQMDDEDSTVVALLHDLVEDTDFDIKKIKQYGFTEAQVTAIETLTHDLSIPYEEYIEKIAENPLATKVKLKDLEHNMDLSRLNKVRPADLERIEKYQKAYDYLSSKKQDVNVSYK